MSNRPPAPEGGAAPERRLPTIFFGSGAFAVPILEATLRVPGVEVVAVVTIPDRPAGRRRQLAATPIARRAAELGLPILRPAGLRTPEAAESIAATRPELAILADYGRIVPPAILAVPRLGFLNLHPSLLPRHRGATPIAGAILAGDLETGVTLFRMDDGLDSGPILAQARWPLDPDATAEDVEARSAVRAAELLIASLPPFLAGSLPARAQDSTRATMTRPMRREDGRLDAAQPAAILERRVRALSPWPGTFVETPALRVLVERAAVVPSEPGDVAGRLVRDGDGLAMATRDGRLRLLQVRPAGGRPMTGTELRHGRPTLVGQPTLPAAGDAGEARREPMPAAASAGRTP